MVYAKTGRVIEPQGLCGFNADPSVQNEVVGADQDGNAEPESRNRSCHFGDMSRVHPPDLTRWRTQSAEAQVRQMQARKNVVPGRKCRSKIEALRRQSFSPCPAFDLELRFQIACLG